MIKTLALLTKAGRATQKTLFPQLPEYSRGLPVVTDIACSSNCSACKDLCPTEAIELTLLPNRQIDVAIDRGKCIACARCSDLCPTGAIEADRNTNIAVLARKQLISRRCGPAKEPIQRTSHTKENPFRNSLHVRVVSTGDSASDMELVASDNPIFDGSRFGIHTVASPRFADALVVTGPVAHGMRDPLLRCYEAMASPRLVVAVGTSAISGGLYAGGYASASGVDAVLPVDAYAPGNPPHPWTILHALMLLMHHKSL